MFGPGFVWLVRHKYRSSPEAELSILTTYLAGSPLPGAHYRKQEVDHNTMMAAGSFGTTSLLPGKDSKIAYGGADLDILLCVNTWQHVWLMDWGIGGKKQFLEAWWEAVDWNVVEERWHATTSEAIADRKKSNPLSQLRKVGRQGRWPERSVY